MKEKDTNQKKKRRTWDKRTIINSIIIFCLSMMLITGVGGFFVLRNVLADNADRSFEGFSSKDSTKLYDANGEVFAELGAESRDNVSYEQIPQVVMDAFLAVEDSRFYKHNGFDLPRFLKSALDNIKQGGLNSGGSTLTMQLVDNTFFAAGVDNAPEANSSLDKIKYKIQEIFLAMDAETEYSKEEIMTLYLNKINFGGPARGIQKASKYYFGKDVSELNLSEAAFLAGLINAPGSYHAYEGYVCISGDNEKVICTDKYQKAVDRRNVALDLMLRHGYISEEECNLAKSTKLAFQLNGINNMETTPYQSYVDFVVHELNEMGYNPYTQSMKIYTSLDRNAQDLSDKILNGDIISFPDDQFQVGFTVMNNQTGEVVAMGGGRNYSGDVRNNRAYIATHQPGSSIKPLLDYAFAFDYLGYATSHIVEDKPMVYTGTNIVISNADGKYRGDMELQRAISLSYNTMAITALQDVCNTIGSKKVVDTMNKMGFEIDYEKFDIGYAIGGSNLVTSPTVMAGAYSTFANNGVYIKPHAIRKIVLNDSNETFIPEYEETQIYSPEAAYLMSYMLENVVSGGWGTYSDIMKSSYPVYGKTGTSDWGDYGKQYGIPEKAGRDKWMVNYTSQYTVATWSGYDTGTNGLYYSTAKANLNIPGKINRALFNELHKDNKPAAIKMPSGVVSITHVKGKYPYAAVPEGTPENLIATGFIKSDYANLETLAPDPVSKLESFDAIYDGSNKLLSLTFKEYPDPSKLVVAPNTKEYTTPVKVIGARIYDPSFVFGPIVYRTEVRKNGEVIASYDLDSNVSQQSLTLKSNEEVQVCGYYSYKYANEKSNEICKTIKNTHTEIEEPEIPVIPENPDIPSKPEE